MDDDELHAEVLAEHAADLFTDASNAFSSDPRRAALDAEPYLERHRAFAADCLATGKVTAEEMAYSMAWLARALGLCKAGRLTTA
ncbi:hypothetical protein [Streptomyces sp. CNZ748]|uniref:hypothetical protein n=1 Tax=Streptomyces sp. CNZ748 TaxID=2885160 RepID=UPI001E611A63|nr:hypothetical protein [Streptomyces sp. CNZ748]